MTSERHLIERIAGAGPAALPGLLQGVGDDCAVLAATESSLLLLTMDTLVEGVHFDLAWHGAEQLAWKTVAVNVSDIAAMGGRPTWCLFSLALPPHLDGDWVDTFSQGLDRALQEYGCHLVGGDTVSSPTALTLTLAVGGEVSRDQVLYRKGARPGDLIWVSGPLGLAAAGLGLLRHGERYSHSHRFCPLFEAHLMPRPRQALGQLLASSGLAHSMMDCSDGLATDLAHMCRASGIGARVEARRLLVHPLVREAAELLGHDPLDWILRGGEDYELLFTTDAADEARLRTLTAEWGYTVQVVGTMVQGEDVVLVQETADQGIRELPITFQGFDHFAARG